MENTMSKATAKHVAKYIELRNAAKNAKTDEERKVLWSKAWAYELKHLAK